MANLNPKVPIALLVTAAVISTLEIGTAVAEGRDLNVLTLIAMALVVVSMVMSIRGVK
ncbi:hypothetical protein [Rubrivirga sp.]|uniref:hypothetical protein n=1 Tax=Rubrivirga sp. TaxID=1885344 RepID=UPI003C722835